MENSGGYVVSVFKVKQSINSLYNFWNTDYEALIQPIPHKWRHSRSDFLQPSSSPGPCLVGHGLVSVLWWELLSGAPQFLFLMAVVRWWSGLLIALAPPSATDLTWQHRGWSSGSRLSSTVQWLLHHCQPRSSAIREKRRRVSSATLADWEECRSGQRSAAPHNGKQSGGSVY